MELTKLTITQTHQGLKKKEFSALELTEAFLNNIQKKDKEVKAFLTITEDLALRQAQAIDDLISQKREISTLFGIPLAVKDNILVEDLKCTAASKILENYIAPYDATVIRKLKSQGAVILGKTNLDEFAMGSSTENSAFQITRNPHDLNRVPGGSSGGSAAAVAAKECVFALGSDTGGSIRQPASFCGVVGLKPTYGAVSRYGLIAFASSLDQIGPITKTVEDAKIVFDAIRGKDELDSTSVESRIENLKFKIEEEGLKIEEISLPYTKYAISCYYIIAPSEASANLARYDGIKYGYSEIQNPKSKIQNLLDVYLESRKEGFGPEVKRRIMLGTYSLSAGYYEAYYLKAQEVRNLIKNDFEKAFEKVDLIFTPVSPFLAFKIGEKIKDPLSMYLADINTVSVNLAGLPALSLPCGKIGNPEGPRLFSKKGGAYGAGLPVGLQIIGKPFEENKIFEIGKLVEKLV